MLGKKSWPMVGMLAGSSASRNESGFMDGATSPRSQAQSPRGLKSFDLGGVGLGIVAALEISGDVRSEIPAIFSRNLSRSRPIPVSSTKSSPEALEMESFEEYTIVTCHGPNNNRYAKVYAGDDRTPFRIERRSMKSNRKASVFHISPARFGEVTGVPSADFLSSCHLCQKKLHGEDIFMYRGEKAFCSTECRDMQIVIDERKEKCSSEATRPSVDASSSRYANGHIFTTGILAT